MRGSVWVLWERRWIAEIEDGVVCGVCCQAEDGIRDLVRSRGLLVRSRGLGDVYKRQRIASGSTAALTARSWRYAT